LKISNNCARFESNTEVTIRFEISNIRTVLLHKLRHLGSNYTHILNFLNFESLLAGASAVNIGILDLGEHPWIFGWNYVTHGI